MRTDQVTIKSVWICVTGAPGKIRDVAAQRTRRLAVCVGFSQPDNSMSDRIQPPSRLIARKITGRLDDDLVRFGNQRKYCVPQPIHLISHPVHF
jgi:hypothetical protein